MRTVAALYVYREGAYADAPAVELWDEERDARTYAGPHPVVAHPPCNRWSSLAYLVASVHGYAVGDDGGCFEAALQAVRTFGGVLEHPAHSLAWERFGLPEPRSSTGWTTSLMDGGASCYVEQGRYGLAARKATWLYAYGVELAELPDLRWGASRADEWAGGWILGTKGPDGRRPKRKGATAAEGRMRDKRASETPLAFRDELLAIARKART